jgi:hypothetical protein
MNERASVVVHLHDVHAGLASKDQIVYGKGIVRLYCCDLVDANTSVGEPTLGRRDGRLLVGASEPESGQPYLYLGAC